MVDRRFHIAASLLLGAFAFGPVSSNPNVGLPRKQIVTVVQAVHDVSLPLAGALPTVADGPQPAAPSVEQTEQGDGPGPEIVAAFDGLGEGFKGPQGTAVLRNPSDNSLAVGPDHIVQLVNTKMAVFTKKGKKFDTTGKVLYGPVNTGNVFKGFGDFGDLNGGDAVVRYDQLADRWLIVMPIFRRLPFKQNAAPGKSGGPVQLSLAGVDGQPGEAKLLHQPMPGEKGGFPKFGKGKDGSYAICYAVSTGPDPLGSYYRYMFERPLFPDYPRPAVWPDGYYVTTSTSDNVIQRHAYVVERDKMLKGEPAREQGFILDDVVFLLNADLDGKQLPPAGAPNIMMTTGGAQLKKIVTDDGIYWWKFHVDWKDPAKSKLDGPVKIPVAPYEYLGGGQLTKTVPQPGTTQKLDVQGDKLMARLVYRRIGDREIIVGAQSVKTAAGGGGIRWYEFRLDDKRNVQLHQQGTYAPDGFYRWMPSPAIDAQGQHRHRLLVRRHAPFPRPALRRPAGRRSARQTDAEGSGARRRRSVANEHDALAGLHPDRHRSERRHDDLVRRRLPEERGPRTTHRASARFAYRNDGDRWKPFSFSRVLAPCRRDHHQVITTIAP